MPTAVGARRGYGKPLGRAERASEAELRNTRALATRFPGSGEGGASRPQAQHLARSLALVTLRKNRWPSGEIGPLVIVFDPAAEDLGLLGLCRSHWGSLGAELWKPRGAEDRRSLVPLPQPFRAV